MDLKDLPDLPIQLPTTEQLINGDELPPPIDLDRLTFKLNLAGQNAIQQDVVCDDYSLFWIAFTNKGVAFQRVSGRRMVSRGNIGYKQSFTDPRFRATTVMSR